MICLAKRYAGKTISGLEHDLKMTFRQTTNMRTLV